MADGPKTMWAWQKHFGSNIPQRVQVPVPSAPADGLLVKVHAAGVCHSDVALLNATARAPYMDEKYTLGHEGCGEIVEIGSSVDPGAFEIGEMVAILSVPGCALASCGECSRHLPQICQTGPHYGIGQDGSYAPYVAIAARAAAKLPPGVGAEVGAVATDAVMTAYHAVVGTGGVKEGEVVVVLGLGGLGFNAVQIAKARGARVVCVDVRREVLEEAVRFGVSVEDCVPVGEDVVAWVRGRALVVDVVLDFVGVPDTFTAAQHMVRFGGRIVLVGLLAAEVTLSTFVAVRKQLSVLCSYGGTMADLTECLKLIATRVVRPQVVTGRLDEFDRVLGDLHAGKVKSRIVLVPGE